MLDKVNKFILLANFTVLDIEEYKDVPIVNEKPFFATGHTIIDVVMGELMMSVFHESKVIKVFEPSEYFDDSMACLDEEKCEDLKCGSFFCSYYAKVKEETTKF